MSNWADANTIMNSDGFCLWIMTVFSRSYIFYYLERIKNIHHSRNWLRKLGYQENLSTIKVLSHWDIKKFKQHETKNQNLEKEEKIHPNNPLPLPKSPFEPKPRIPLHLRPLNHRHRPMQHYDFLTRDSSLASTQYLYEGHCIIGSQRTWLQLPPKRQQIWPHLQFRRWPRHFQAQLLLMPHRISKAVRLLIILKTLTVPLLFLSPLAKLSRGHNPTSWRCGWNTSNPMKEKNASNLILLFHFILIIVIIIIIII